MDDVDLGVSLSVDKNILSSLFESNFESIIIVIVSQSLWLGSIIQRHCTFGTSSSGMEELKIELARYIYNDSKSL